MSRPELVQKLLGEQASSIPVALVGHPRDDEEIPTAEGLHVVDQRFSDETGLDGFELAMDVLLEADEDVACLEVAVGVETEVVVVGASKESLVGGGFRPGIGESDVRVEGNDLALWIGGVVGGVEFVIAVERSPGVPPASEHSFLFG